MNIHKYYKRNALLVLISGILLFTACEKPDEIFERTRLFQPVLNEDLYSIDNTIIVNMGNMKEATSYTIELSRDTFKTEPLISIMADTSFVEIDGLLWNTIYQVRAQAHADETEYDSKVTDLGNVRTQRYPSILHLPGEYDVTDTRARLSWTTAGAAVTTVKVYAIEDEELKDPLFELELTEEELEAEVKIVPGLEPETEYQVAIYSGEALRGWVEYFTKEALPSGDHVYDLSGLGSSALAEALSDPEIPGGSIFILEGGVTYETGGYKFDKSATIMSGYGWVPGGAIIDCSSNFNLAPGSNVESIVFSNVTLTGDFSGNYAFNIDQSGHIGELKFDNCRIRSLRGVVRMKGGDGTLDNFTIVNSVADSINGYGVLSVDTETWTTENILLKNSTFSKTQYFLVSRTNTNTLTIEDCTIDKAPEGGRQLFRWRGSEGNDNITGGIKIYNTIIGPGWDMSDGENIAIDGFDGLSNTNFDVTNSYVTADFAIGDGKDEIPGFNVYNKSADDLWEDRAQVDYSIKDSGFPGKNNSGDPRWRPGI